MLTYVLNGIGSNFTQTILGQSLKPSSRRLIPNSGRCPARSTSFAPLIHSQSSTLSNTLLPYIGDGRFKQRITSHRRWLSTIYAITALKDGKFVTGIEPFKDFKLDRFTRVTWTNNSKVAVRLRLGQGKQCKEASNIMMLILDAEFIAAKCYVTREPIPAGGVLETRFEEAGRFPYEIEFIGEKAKESGIIRVY